MNRRLFIGFPVEVSSSLESALKKVRLTAEQKRMEINWVPQENFHVTLNFIGNTSASRVSDLESLLAKVSGTTPRLKSSLRGMGGFPDDRHMRVLWVGVRRSRAMTELHERLYENLIAAEFPQEGRDFVPHLTVGRTRKARSVTDLISPFVRNAFGDVSVDALSLYESRMHGNRPVYIPLNRFELTGVAAEDTEADIVSSFE